MHFLRRLKNQLRGRSEAVAWGTVVIVLIWMAWQFPLAGLWGGSPGASEPDYLSASSLGIVALLSAFMAVRSWRCAWNQMFSEEPELRWSYEDFRADIIDFDSPPGEPFQYPVWIGLSAMIKSDPAAAEIEIQTMMLKHPKSLVCRLCLAEALTKQGRLAEADAEMRELFKLPLREGTVVLQMRSWLSHRLLAGNIELVTQEIGRLRNTAGRDRATVLVLDTLSTACLSHPTCRPFLRNADEWSRAAIEIEPNSTTLKGTRGSILIELGADDLGACLLAEVLAEDKQPINVGICSLYLAIVAKRRSDPDKAMAHAARARKVYPQPWLLDRLTTEGL